MDEPTIPEEGDEIEVEYTTEDGERKSQVVNVLEVLEEDDLSPADEFVGMDHEEHRVLLKIVADTTEKVNLGREKQIVYDVLLAEEASLFMRTEDTEYYDDWDVLGGDVEWDVL